MPNYHEAIHCEKKDVKTSLHPEPKKCSECDYRRTCAKTTMMLSKGYVRGYDGKFRKATETDRMWYIKNFGEKWCSTHLGH